MQYKPCKKACHSPVEVSGTAGRMHVGGWDCGGAKGCEGGALCRVGSAWREATEEVRGISLVFLRLLEMASEEFGFSQAGGLALSCRPCELERIISDL